MNWSISRILHGVKDDLLSFFFPPVCTGCGEKLRENESFFCSVCHDAFDSIPPPICPLCGAPLGNHVLETRKCPECPSGEVHFDSARSAFLYRGAIAEGVKAFKFRSRIELSELFARILYYQIRKKMSGKKFDVIVPVPLHFRRYMQRGYNQAGEIARIISRETYIDHFPDAIKRVRATKAQSGLHHDDRRENVKDAFSPSPGDRLKNKKVLLIDDVYTTGSTINACAGAIKKGGAESVTALTICRALTLDA